jgi:hypothetical protein
MAKYLIEVPHESGKASCARAVQSFLQTGSHFLANADWGCIDGEHKAWLMVEMDSKEDARFILPPDFRSQAKVVQLNRFTLRDVDEVLRGHPR